MNFAKRLKECREAKNLSQAAFAANIGVHKSLIGKYERDEVKPSIDIALKIAEELDTTIGYLIGESSDEEILKDNAMLKRMVEIGGLPTKDKECILYLIDGLIRDAKTRLAYA